MRRVSASIVMYGDIEKVKQTIDSVLDYHPEVDLYVINNGMPRPEFEAWLTGQPVTYIQAPTNLGFGKGHNLVLDKIQSEYHAIINPDTLLEEDSLEKLAEFMDRHPEVGMCVPRVLYPDHSTQNTLRKTPTPLLMFMRFIPGLHWFTLYRQEENVPFAHGSFFFIRTNLFKQIGGFDPRYHLYMEDADLCRTVNLTSSVAVCPDTDVLHAWKKASHKNPYLTLVHVGSILKYWAKWGIFS